LKALFSRILLSVLVAGLLLGALMAWGGVSPAAVARTIAGLPPGAYVAALGLHFVTYCIRAARFRFLIPKRVRPGFRRTLLVASAHNLASYVLPAKMGEASFPVYMRMQCGLPSSVGLATLLVARFLDAAMLCTGLATACLVLRSSGRYPGLTWLGLVGAALVLATLFFLVLSLHGDLLVRMFATLLRWLRLHHWRLGEAIIEQSNSLTAALRASASAGRIWVAMLLSVPLWFTIFGFYTLLVRAMGLSKEIGLLEAGFGASLASAFNLLPINGFAGVGTQEIGWITGFNQLLGYNYDLVLGVGIGVHLIQLFNIVLMGLLAHLAMGILPSQALRELEPVPQTPRGVGKAETSAGSTGSSR